MKYKPAALDASRPVLSPEEYPFNDPGLPQQWHYYNDGSLEKAVEGADINLFKGWEINTGRPDVIVAVVDMGVQYDHPDLAANMWINEAEMNGTPGVDDDGNGYVDDIYGWNYYTDSGTITQHFHGTHVAGTVAAVNNNGIGRMRCGRRYGQWRRGTYHVHSDGPPVLLTRVMPMHSPMPPTTERDNLQQLGARYGCHAGRCGCGDRLLQCQCRYR